MAYRLIHHRAHRAASESYPKKKDGRLPAMEQQDILKQEELTIKVLLQQNLREQELLLAKQESLTKIKDNMLSVSKSTSLLYKPEQTSRDTLKRLRHLQRTYMTSYSR